MTIDRFARGAGRAALLAFVLGGLAAASGCAAMAAEQKRIDTARAASYDVPPQVAYQETYALLSSEYKIARESESRGFIESDWKDETDIVGNPVKSRVTAEVIQATGVRVVLRVEASGPNGTPNPDHAKAKEDDLYVRVHDRLNAPHGQPAVAGGGQ